MSNPQTLHQFYEMSISELKSLSVTISVGIPNRHMIVLKVKAWIHAEVIVVAKGIVSIHFIK